MQVTANCPETLHITENKTVLLETRRQIRSQIKRLRGEQSDPQGEELVIQVDVGRWFIVERPAQGAMNGPGAPAKQRSGAQGGRCFVTSSQGALRRNRCAATCFSVVSRKQLVVDKDHERFLPGLPVRGRRTA